VSWAEQADRTSSPKNVSTRPASVHVVAGAQARAIIDTLQKPDRYPASASMVKN